MPHKVRAGRCWMRQIPCRPDISGACNAIKSGDADGRLVGDMFRWRRGSSAECHAQGRVAAGSRALIVDVVVVDQQSAASLAGAGVKEIGALMTTASSMLRQLAGEIAATLLGIEHSDSGSNDPADGRWWSTPHRVGMNVATRCRRDVRRIDSGRHSSARSLLKQAERHFWQQLANSGCK